MFSPTVKRESIMEYEIKIHREEKFVEIITSGVADRDGSLEMANAIKDAMKSNGFTKALIDHRNIDSVSGQTFEIYERPGLFKLIGLLLKIKIAEIIKPEHIDHFKFFETVSKNRGYNISIFQDKESALVWLLNK